MEADIRHPPWSAVALLLVPNVSRCTAVAVAPHWVAAAAHCLFNRALNRVVPPGSVHLLIGYRSGTYARLLFPDAIRLAPGADPAFRGVRGSDLALLHVAETLAGTLPPVAVAQGAPVQLGGFGQDRAERLVVDPDCMVSAIIPAPDGHDLVRHDCSGTRGSSGGALVVRTGSGSWGLAGVQVAAEMGRSSGYAVPGEAVAALLEAVQAGAPP